MGWRMPVDLSAKNEISHIPLEIFFEIFCLSKQIQIRHLAFGEMVLSHLSLPGLRQQLLHQQHFTEG